MMECGKRRYIQSHGQAYWCRWTTKECGTWGQRYGEDSIWGNSCIWGCGLLNVASPVNMIFPETSCFAAKHLHIVLDCFCYYIPSHFFVELFYFLVSTCDGLRAKRKKREDEFEINLSWYIIIYYSTTFFHSLVEYWPPNCESLCHQWLLRVRQSFLFFF